jgi:hypothetical protein
MRSCSTRLKERAARWPVGVSMDDPHVELQDRLASLEAERTDAPLHTHYPSEPGAYCNDCFGTGEAMGKHDERSRIVRFIEDE